MNPLTGKLDILNSSKFYDKKNFSSKRVIKGGNNKNSGDKTNSNSINNKEKVNLNTLFSYLDISKLYLIKVAWIKKYSFIIFSILAILFCASLYIVVFKDEVNLFVYYSTWSIIPGLCMVYLMYKDRNYCIKLSVNSMHLISNLALLSLILASVIYIVANLLISDLYLLSFSESFDLSRKIFGIWLILKITVSTIEKVYSLRNECNKFYEALFSILLSLMVLAFFYQVIFVIFGAVFLVFEDIKLIKFKCELKYKNNSEVKHELIIVDKSLDHQLKKDSNSKSELITKDKSLNHHFKKDYPTVVKAKGHYLFTKDGNKVFDAASGAGVASLGYSNLEIIAAIAQKYWTFIFGIFVLKRLWCIKITGFSCE